MRHIFMCLLASCSSAGYIKISLGFRFLFECFIYSYCVFHRLNISFSWPCHRLVAYINVSICQTSLLQSTSRGKNQKKFLIFN